MKLKVVKELGRTKIYGTMNGKPVLLLSSPYINKDNLTKAKQIAMNYYNELLKENN